MTIPFYCLFIVALLPYTLAFTGMYFRTKAPGGLDNKNPRKQVAQLEGPGARAYAAQQNAWEALPVFTAAVVTAHLMHANPQQSAMAAMVFVMARILHPIAYLIDQDRLRSAMFGIGTLSWIWLFVLAIRG